ncbi:uncharacterized protein LOC129962358 [Argiope bruennichi]|uniref:uncharacterized protein LOC129962358 n=1 Tax=Argiope bruennichi TaxID=94029 RepID=UPI0024958C98|nr:uncharacterized protein LOC129962358 [Argiope bruennichi]
MNLNPCITTPAIQSYTVKLPTIKLEPFNGDVELWQSFWEQFQSFVDNNPNLSVIDKHVFLRGYLQDEPKRLVDGISIIADTYEAIKKLLMDKYGDKNRIIQAHLDFLENLTPIRNLSPTSLNEVFIECNRRLQALRALGEDVNSYGRILTPKILRAFPDDICRRWIIFAKRQKISEGDITKLIQFLSEEVEGALTTLKIRGEQSVQYDFKPSTANLYVNSKNTTTIKKRSPFCAICDTNGHWPQDCNIVTDIDIRKQKLKNSNRCFLCTNRGHNVNNCPRKDKARCYKCKKRHHVSICKTVSENPNLTTIPVTSTNNVDIITPKFTHLQTARVYVIGPTGKTKVTRCLLDGGSQSSFIHPSLIDFLQLEITSSEKLNLQAFESISTNTETRRRVKFILSSIWSNSKINIQAFESSNTYAFHPSTPQPVSSFAHSQKLKLADPSDSLNDLPIEILIGADFYWTIVHTKSPIRLSATHVLIPTVFGWILSGNRSFTTIAYSSVSSILNISSETLVLDLDDHVRRFWDLETIGIKTMQDKGMTIRNSEILSDFHNSFCKVDGRRVVKLPWKPEMQNYIDNQHVELADNSPCNESKLFYLPHHIVKKQKNDEKKWRIVFDASSHTPGHPSLNDALEQGPNLLPEIFATLLRFRLHKFAITSDGRQAFLQLILDEEDRNCTKFLWFRTEKDANGKIHLRNEILTYRFSRLPFGLTSSPFLLSATLRELANMHSDSYPTAAKHLENNIFMDDFVMGVDTAEQTTTLYQEMQDLMTQISLRLAKWSTNSKNLQAIWELKDIIFKCNTQVLGINWKTKEDVFHTDINESVYQFAVPATKRLLLKIVSKLYDPLGLYAPAIVVGKILFQTTWLMGVQWNEILPPGIAASFNRWVSEISSLNKIHIPRWIGISATSHMSIHVFCDASEKAYGAAIYICFTERNERKVHLVCSRNRLSPLKKVTLPRLELLAALLGARLLHYFCKETGLENQTSTLWSDSTVVLSWIRNYPNRWKTFVCNRVTEILQYTFPAQWRHCLGTQNPADHLSRGVFPAELPYLETWWNGPSWLAQISDAWPVQNILTNKEKLLMDIEARQVKNQTLCTSTIQTLIDISRFSSYTKLLRITAWIYRFLNNCKSRQHFTSELTADELNKARNYWISVVQKQSFSVEINALEYNRSLPKSSKISRFRPFLKDNILRLGGRLQFARISVEQRHPILLEGSHYFVHLLIRHTHIRLHHLGVRVVLSELRSEFWILRGRQAIKRVIKTCLPCKLSHALSSNEIEDPLPADRLTSCMPFDTTGIDFAGPVYIKTFKPSNTAYITLFTCSTTRALHIELVSDLSVDKFLLALQRFVSRRGLPHTIYSDNATTFHATNKEFIFQWNTLTSTKVQQFYAHNGIKWKFIAPRAAWWGGWWERLIGLTKRCLRKSLGRSLLDEEALTTVLVGIEASLNSRPLIYERGENDTEEALTPAHFLTGRKLTIVPSGPESRNDKITNIYRQQQDLLDTFWKRWSKEYLLELRTFHQVRNVKETPRVRVGDLVLLQEDLRPRQMWKKALVVKLIDGRDGRIRTCILRVKGKEITRPIQLVIPLEVDQGGEDVAHYNMRW